MTQKTMATIVASTYIAFQNFEPKNLEVRPIWKNFVAIRIPINVTIPTPVAQAMAKTK